MPHPSRPSFGHALHALATLTLALSLTACMSAYKKSVGGGESEVYTRIYLTDFNMAWQSSLDALKASPLDISNREGGFIQTKWTDNTAQKNFTDSFGAADNFLSAKFRFRVTVAKGFYNGKPSVKMSVQKEQIVQRDVLESPRLTETDGIDERTLLYRMGRIITMRTRLAKLEEDKIKHGLENSGDSRSSTASPAGDSPLPPPPSGNQSPPSQDLPPPPPQ